MLTRHRVLAAVASVAAGVAAAQDPTLPMPTQPPAAQPPAAQPPIATTPPAPAGTNGLVPAFPGTFFPPAPTAQQPGTAPFQQAPAPIPAQQYPAYPVITGPDQYGVPGGVNPRPPVSPYLNLYRNNNAFGGGGFNAIDYYNFVRPSTQNNPALFGRNQGFGNNAGAGFNPTTGFGDDVVLDPGTAVRATGHPSAFMTTAGYYNSLGTIGQARAAAPGQARRR